MKYVRFTHSLKCMHEEILLFYFILLYYINYFHTNCTCGVSEITDSLILEDKFNFKKIYWFI